MDVLDLRPAGERRLEALWRRWDSHPGPVVAALARATSAGLAAATVVRASRRTPPPGEVLVVAVGNLRAGGTGKTPVVARLMRDLADLGLGGAVVTRGHGGAAHGPLRVAPDDPRAGDEARLLARLAADGWSVIQARRRSEGVDAARAARPTPEIVLLDDGFQTAGVGRHLDVLILDRWEEAGDVVTPRTGRLLPWGPYREPAAAAGRAGVWLLERPGPWPDDLRACMPGVTVLGFAREARLRSVGVASWGSGPVALLSGLARPGGFERHAAGLLDAAPRLAVRCRDHARYDVRTLARILAQGRARGVTAWVTTAKDWVKLGGLWPAEVAVAVVDLHLAWHGAPALPRFVMQRRRAQVGAS